ncbi:MAG: UDP-3-O-(3-hydroxymyristoyl)glucosamine N-acyltransferase [Ignavibacteria bacterium]|nr:UDP-3-O-(3-hydroxymyristoyl)glucosamine N-acyltransferase [Ignavibacteria bacterium]
MKLSEIAKILNVDFDKSKDIEINRISKIESSSQGDISFIANPQYEKYYSTTNASALIVNKNFHPENLRDDIFLLAVDDSYNSFVRILNEFSQGLVIDKKGISEKSSTGKNCAIGENIFIDDFVSIGNNCFIGDNVKIFSNTTIGDNVKISDNTVIYAGVIIYNDCEIGKNNIIHSGTIIGSDGFGQVRQTDGSFKKIPQIGNVVTEEDVEIGSNCSIDRATIGETRICKGVKLDNQIQVAHNVIIGENTVIAAQTGIAGSTKIGKRCMIGGQAGIVGHIEICDDVIIGASVGVSKSITKPGVYLGYRAKPQAEDLKQEVRIRNLEKLEKRVKELELIIKNLPHK